MNDLLLLQIFLSHKREAPGPGIFEVSFDKDDLHLECNCPGFISKSACKHTRLVQGRIDKNGGMYPWEFSKKFTPAELAKAVDDPAAFRELVVKYGKIEVY